MSEQKSVSAYQSDVFASAYPETAPFWQAAEEGKLLLKRCESCGKPHWYPRIVCPHCGSDQVTWYEASGQGTIYSFSVIEKANIPYILAWIQLEEGPIVTTNLVEVDAESVRIGGEVSIRFAQTDDGRTVPVFAAQYDA